MLRRSVGVASGVNSSTAFMELQFILNSVGLGMPKMQFGINLATFGFLKLRADSNDPVTVYRIQEILTLSGTSTTLVSTAGWMVYSYSR